MPDYSKGKIYKLWSPSKNLVYYGSTTQTLAQRLTDHKKKREVHRACSYLIMECDDYKIELIEEYPCNNKTQLLRKEGEYIINNECINLNVAGRTKQEHNKIYRETNKEKIKAYQKQYWLKNKEILLQKKEDYQLKKQNNIAKE